MRKNDATKTSTLSNVALRTWHYLAGFEIKNVNALVDLKYNTKWNATPSDAISYYANVVSEFPVSTAPAFYDTSSAEYTTLKPYFNSNKLTSLTPEVPEAETETTVSVDYSSKIAAISEAAGDTSSAMLLAGVDSTTSSGDKYMPLFKDTLTATYDMTAILAGFQAKISNASTAEAVKAVVEEYSAFIDTDLNILSNMDYVYADIAKTTATTDYTFETLAAAIENGAKAYLKEVTYTPDNYAMWNRYDGNYQSGIAVNTNLIPSQDATQQKTVSSINLKLWRYLSAYKLNNTDAITKMSLNTSFGAVGSWLKFYATPVASFPVSTEPAFYVKSDSEHATLVSYIEKDNVTTVSDGSVYANSVASIDYSSKIEALNAATGEDGSVVLLTSVASEIGGGGATVKLFEDSLKVTYDMTAIMDGYREAVAAADTAQKMQAAVEKYNDFIGADLNALVNMNYVYNDLIANRAEYTEPELLKAAFDEFVEGYKFDVTYTMPDDYYYYKPDAGAYNGGFGGKYALVNMSYAQMTQDPNANDDIDPVGQYRSLFSKDSYIDTYYLKPIFSYDIYSPEAVVDVKYTVNAQLRKAVEGELGKTHVVGWAASDTDIVDTTPAAFESDTEVYNAIVAWHSANKNVATTTYDVPTETGVVATTQMNIPADVKAALQSGEGMKKLIMTFNCKERSLLGSLKQHALTVTYDRTALSEGEMDLVIDGYQNYTVTTDSMALLEDGADVEILQTSKDLEGDFTVIAAAYKEGALVGVKTQTATAPGFMGKVALNLTGVVVPAEITDTTEAVYDTLKVMALDGLGTIKPLGGTLRVK